MEQKAVQPLQGFFFHAPFEQNFWPDILEETYTKQLYLPFLPHTKDSVCIDIGANVGMTTYYFAQRFGTVYSVEPSALHREALSTMITYNKLSNVNVVPYALSNKDGKTKFYHNDNQTMYSMEEVLKNDNFEEVDTIAMDTLFEKYKIDKVDLMKLDAEGSESQIITSEGFVKVAPRIKAIVFEWHNWTSMRTDMFQRTLEELGYEVRWRHDLKATVGGAVRV